MSMKDSRTWQKFLSAFKENLEVRPNYPDEIHLFLSQKRSPLKPRSIYDIVKKYLARAGVANPNITVHFLRDTMATNLYNQHKDIRLVQKSWDTNTFKQSLNTPKRPKRKKSRL